MLEQVREGSMLELHAERMVWIHPTDRGPVDISFFVLVRLLLAHVRLARHRLPRLIRFEVNHRVLPSCGSRHF